MITQIKNKKRNRLKLSFNSTNENRNKVISPSVAFLNYNKNQMSIFTSIYDKLCQIIYSAIKHGTKMKNLWQSIKEA